MTNPFPGVDPYIEDQGYWPDFHNRFLTHCADFLGDRLPENYEARIDERFRVFDLDEGSARDFLPDVAVVRARANSDPAAIRGGGPGPLLLEPVIVPAAEPVLAKERLTWIEVRRMPDRERVTVIELLSPSNKSGRGREEYLQKRAETIAEQVHLVELDFLLAGRRVPLAGPLPPGDFYAMVTRGAARRRTCAVYAWSIRQPLPLVPIPLRAPDPDVPLDLLAVFTEAYDRGRYRRFLDVRAPLKTPLEESDRAWVEERVRPAPPA